MLRKGGSWKPVFSRTFINQLLLATVNTAIGLHQVCQWMQKLKELQPCQKQQRLARLRWCRCSWNERLPDFIAFFGGCCWNFNQVGYWFHLQRVEKALEGQLISSHQWGGHQLISSHVNFGTSVLLIQCLPRVCCRLIRTPEESSVVRLCGEQPTVSWMLIWQAGWRLIGIGDLVMAFCRSNLASKYVCFALILVASILPIPSPSIMQLMCSNDMAKFWMLFEEFEPAEV